MSKALLIAAILSVILLVAMLMWPAAGTPGPAVAPQAGAPAPPAAGAVAPYATAGDFYAAWQAYLGGATADAARITATAAQHRDWVSAIFPQSYKDFHDGIRLNMGKYRILYPYLSETVIDNYNILLTEVSNNEPESVTLLIRCGANPNKKLILTAANSPHMIDVLIGAGADPNLPRIDGSSPLDFFKHLGRPDLIEAMMRNGAR